MASPINADANANADAAADGGRGRRLPLRLLALLGTLAAFGPLAIDMYLPALPRIAGNLHASTSSVQLTLTACTVGLGVGQLIAGPLSDRLGRRVPLFVGVLVFTVFSLGCALAPTLPVLLVCRFLQALGGAAGIVIARAIARDLRTGPELARLLSVIQAINGLAPILAPVLGAQIVRFTSWRGVFVALTGLGALILLFSMATITETLPVERRRSGGVADVWSAYRGLLRDPVFMALVLSGALAFAAMFAYISGSPFVLENHYGLSAQMFSLIFAVNAGGLILGTRVSAGTPVRTMRSGLWVILVGAGTALAALVGGLGLPLLLPGFLLVSVGFGMAGPNAAALALADHPESAGSAAAVLGATQFLLGGLLAPLGGLGGRPVTVAAVMAACAVAALASGTWALRRDRVAGSPTPETPSR